MVGCGWSKLARAGGGFAHFGGRRLPSMARGRFQEVTWGPDLVEILYGNAYVEYSRVWRVCFLY